MRRILFAAWCAAIAAAAQAAPKADPVQWTLDGTTFEGVLVHDDDDDDGRKPGLLMVPNWRGVNDSAIGNQSGVTPLAWLRTAK